MTGTYHAGFPITLRQIKSCGYNTVHIYSIEVTVKVWLLKRRKMGVEVPAADACLMAAEIMPVELIIESCTDQGLRQPGKVARVYEAGRPRLLGELERPRLVWMQRTGLILTGIEKRVDNSKQVVRFSQSWMCAFAPPLDTCEMRISDAILAYPSADWQAISFSDERLS